MTPSDQRPQKAPSLPDRPMMRRAFTRVPRMASSAGSSVRAASTENTTTSAPPSPIERIDMKGMLTRPRRPTTTVRPLKKMERPANSTVVTTASSTLRPARSSSRNRPTMNSE